MPALSLVEALAQVPDPRDPRGRRHPLVAVLSLTVVAILTGQRSLEAIVQFGRDHGFALARALGFTRGKTPCKSMLSELFRALDSDAFEAALRAWLASRGAAGWTAVALDGKTVRGSADGEVPGVHLLAAFAPAAAVVLGQLRVDSKTNEHKAALRLLGVLPLAGAVVTGDAMFCHRDVCAAIRDRGGHYLLAVKDNQAALRADIEAALADDPSLSPLRATAATGAGAGGAHGDERTRPV